MGMGNYPCYADTIEKDFVEEICPQELHDFKVALDEADVSINDIAYAFFSNQGDDLETCCNVSQEEAKNILEKWEILYKMFLKETGGLELDLELDLVQHEKDDRGDELDGRSFAVDGVYVLSAAGKKYKNKIERKSWNEFG